MCPRCGHVAGRMKEGCNHIVCTKPCTQVFCFKCFRDWELCKGKCKGGSTELLTQKAKVEDPSIAKDVLNELKDTSKEEMRLVDQQNLAKETLKKIEYDCAVCMSTIDQTLLDGSASVASDIRRLMDNFVTTLHAACGVLVLPKEVSDDRTFAHEDEDIEEEPAYSDEDEEVEAQLNRKRAPTGDPLIRRLLKRPRTEIVDDEEEELNDLEADSDSDEDTAAHDDGDDEGGFDIEDEYRSDDDDDDEEQGNQMDEDHIEW
ncbi:hypothetical protein QM012_008413 [Aureobasidium pullulans]|uniref:RING-type domain-containing protein n=1 Tax=Aureobasidium pullulans TaxID=5580 RepID=A0ABR0TKZ0_AURPU